jgi:hypothetical protein
MSRGFDIIEKPKGNEFQRSISFRNSSWKLNFFFEKNHWRKIKKSYWVVWVITASGDNGPYVTEKRKKNEDARGRLRFDPSLITAAAEQLTWRHPARPLLALFTAAQKRWWETREIGDDNGSDKRNSRVKSCTPAVTILRLSRYK